MVPDVNLFSWGQKDVIKKRIGELLDQNRTFTNGVVIAEPLVGATGKKEMNGVQENLLK
jgi:hypothetical protein